MTDSQEMSSFESKVRKSYQAESPDPHFAGALRRQIALSAAKPHPRTAPRFSLVSRLAMAAGTCAIALTLLFVAAPQSDLVLGMRQLFSFIPGVGIVDQDAPLRQIAEPVSETQDGITVSIDRMVLSPDLTAFHFQVNGVPESTYPQDMGTSCGGAPYLRLPDGSRIEHNGFNAVDAVASGPFYSMDFVLKSVPAEVDNAVLVMPCILGLKEGAAPENWEFPLSFVPVSAEFATLPVEEVEPVAATAAEAEPKGQYDHLLRLDFDKRVSLPDGDIMYGKIYWQTDSPFYNPTMEMEALTDANGNRLPTFHADLDSDWNPLEEHNYTPYAMYIPNSDAPGPWKLSAETMLAMVRVEGVSIEFDAGENPQVGQKWILNKDIRAGEFTLRLVSVNRTEKGYEVLFDNPEEVGCVDLSFNLTNGLRGECDHNYSRFDYNEVPAGKLTIGIHNIDVRLKGNWAYTWMP